MEKEICHLRSAIREAEQVVGHLKEDLNVTQQKLERSQDLQNRWKERAEALVEQLQAEQNRSILAEQASVKHLNKIQNLKLHYQQVCINRFSIKL